MEKDFNKLLESISDGRRENSVTYGKKILLLGSIIAVLSGAYNPAAIHEFFLRHFGSEAPKAPNSIRNFFLN